MLPLSAVVAGSETKGQIDEVRRINDATEEQITGKASRGHSQ